MPRARAVLGFVCVPPHTPTAFSEYVLSHISYGEPGGTRNHDSQINGGASWYRPKITWPLLSKRVPYTTAPSLVLCLLSYWFIKVRRLAPALGIKHLVGCPLH